MGPENGEYMTRAKTKPVRLPVAAERQGIVFLPGRPTRSMIVTATLAQTTILFANAGKTTRFTVLVHRFRDPVNSRVTTNSFVVGVNQDNLVVLVDTILIDPVRVEDSKVTASAANSLLRNTPQTTLGFEVVNTLANGLTKSSTLGNVLFAVTPPDTNTIDNITLLGLVTQSASLIGARRTGSTVNDLQLAVFPAPHTEKETEDIRLLLFVELPDVFVCTHLAGWLDRRRKVSPLIP